MNSEGSHWSIEALKEYMDRRFQTMTEAVAVANSSMDRRLEGMDELRNQLHAERSFFLTKDEYEVRHNLLESRLLSDTEKIEARLAVLERWQAKLLGAMALVLLLIPILTALAVYYITNHHAP